MVRREGSRFGIISNHSVRRPQRFSQHRGQHVVIKSTGRVPEGMPQTDVELSLNKKGRWNLSKDLSEKMTGQQGTLIISEHHWTGRSHSKEINCLSVTTQTRDLILKKRSRSTYSCYDHLMDGLEVIDYTPDENDSRGSRKRRGKKQFHSEDEEKIIHCKVYTKVERKAGLKANSSWSSQSSKSSKARKGFSGGNLPFFEDYYDDETFYEEEDSPLADAIAASLITAQTDRMSCDEKAPLDEGPDCGTARLDEFIVPEKENIIPSVKTGIPSETTLSRKEKVIYVDREDYEIPRALNEYKPLPRNWRVSRKRGKKQKQQAKLQLVEQSLKTVAPPDCAIFTTPVYPASVSNLHSLFSDFGDVCFQWGLCKPHCCGANIASYIEQNLVSAGYHQTASTLKENGHEFWILIQRLPEMDEAWQGDSDKVALQIKLIGFPVDEGLIATKQKKLQMTNSFYLNDSISLVKEYIDCIPLESYFTTKSQYPGGKPVIALDTVSHFLKWTTECVAPMCLVNKAMDKPCDTAELIKKEEEFLDDVGCNVVCSICFEDDLVSDNGLAVYATSLKSCGHWFCNDCWRQFLTARIDQGFTDLTCPEVACKSKIDKVTLMCQVPATVYNVHLKHIEDSEIGKHPDWEYCPKPGCNFLLRQQNIACTSPQTLVCLCGGSWCSECKEESHWPAGCQEVADYREKCLKRGRLFKFGNIKWVSVKRCPRCNKGIEKNGGCPHMSCLCGYQFCWYCLSEWDGHRAEVDCPKRASFETVMLEDFKPLPQVALEYAMYHHERRTRRAIKMRKSNAERLRSRAYTCLQRRKPGNLELVSLYGSSDFLEEVDITGSILRKISFLAEDGVKFCGEAEFVLEFLEVKLSRRFQSPSKKTCILSQRDKLWYISNQIHEIFESKNITDPIAAFTRLNRLIKNGKQTLRCLAATLQKG